MKADEWFGLAQLLFIIAIAGLAVFGAITFPMQTAALAVLIIVVTI